MAHITDSVLYGDGFCIPEIREMFTDEARLQRWLDVEGALALVQGELGVIPEAAAREIAMRAHLKNIDVAAVRNGIIRTSHSLVPLLQELQRACNGGYGEFVHFGATTQDIQDTGSALEMRDVSVIIARDVAAVMDILADMAERHCDTPMAAKTHGQHALVTTFGYRLSIGLRELARHVQRLHEAAPRVFRVSLFGGVGNMSSLPKGVETMRALAAQLGLEPADVSWHTSRDCIAEFVCLMSMIASTLGRIANDVFVLARTECAEVSEGHFAGRIGSSTMPHKRNPEIAQRIVLLARLTKYHATIALEAMIAEDDRDMRSLRADWVSIGDVCAYTATAARLTRDLFANLNVHPERMEANLRLEGDHVFSEAIMFHLGRSIGKQTAHRVVYEAAMRARDRGESLVDLLLANDEIRTHTTRHELERLQVPLRNVGAAVEMTKAAVAQTRRELRRLSAVSSASTLGPRPSGIYHFSAGPAMLPPTVLRELREIVAADGGPSPLEIPHNSAAFHAVIDEIDGRLRELAGIPRDFEVLWMHGGARMQFSAVPLNLLPRSRSRRAGYVESGYFAAQARREASRYGVAELLASSAASQFDRIPDLREGEIDPDLAYVHITSNNTVFGTQWQGLPPTRGVPVVVDATSDILSRRMNFSQVGLLYAGVQKNLGATGLAVVVVHKALLGHPQPEVPLLLDYTAQAEHRSLLNTPNMFALYLVRLMLRWSADQGGVAALEDSNQRKADCLYRAIDESSLYVGTAQRRHRSLMNVTFRLAREDLCTEFLRKAEASGLHGLAGHRSVGGIRASIYNSMPLDGVQTLTEFMREFERTAA